MFSFLFYFFLFNFAKTGLAYQYILVSDWPLFFSDVIVLFDLSSASSSYAFLSVLHSCTRLSLMLIPRV